jgi:uncharacterized protein (TIGR00299 family) protein
LPRIAYLDCFSGISGDMFLGALVDAGVPSSLLEQTVAALDIGARIEVSKVVRGGISATKVDVYSHGEKDLPREQYWAQRAKAQPHPHHHDHGHAHDHSSHSPAPDDAAARTAVAPPHGRGLSEIRGIITRAPIAEGARQKAIAIFEALGCAEAKIHATEVERIHFHEVGAVDAMVDIVCAAVGSETLGVDEIICSPLNVGGGTVECAHGTLPVPAPATLELLKHAPVYSSGLQAELVTPTGAAIVATLASRFAPLPALRAERVGYGAGARDFPGQPNVLRLTIGESAGSDQDTASTSGQDSVIVLESNLDDMSPQVFGYVMERLLEEGALDVFAAPVQMKKNRPGTLVTVLARPGDDAKLTGILFAETTTLGVRQRRELRQCLARRWETVVTPWGEVRIKVASLNGVVANCAPEFEDCRKLAAQHRVPLKQVMQEAMRLYRAVSS